MPRKLPYKDWSPEAKARLVDNARRWHADHRDKVNAGERRRNAAEKLKILAAYGRFCVCCGEDEPVFLSLDHVHGGGRQDRAGKAIGTQFYRKLRREGFPPGFQILCFNCNAAKRTKSVCPHRQLVRARMGLAR